MFDFEEFLAGERKTVQMKEAAIGRPLIMHYSTQKDHELGRTSCCHVPYGEPRHRYDAVASRSRCDCPERSKRRKSYDIDGTVI